ncbi:MAG: S8/S53 family peptidase [Flavobacteriales bacterium]
MERTKKITILFLFVASFAFSQNFYFEIVFKDKGSMSLSDAEQFLSAASIEKKAKRGVEIDFFDLPLVSSYIETIELQGVDVVKQSKWRNSVLILTQDSSLIAPVRSILFVKSATFFTELPNETFKSQNKFADEEVQWYSHKYGQSLNQLSMLNGHFLHERGFNGEGMDIAIFDAGFPEMFSAITLLKEQGRIKNTYDFVDHDATVFEKDQHGAMVLSVMASNDDHMFGAAPMANYHLFITEDAQKESLLEEYNWLMAAEMADSIGVDVVNSSLGYTTFDNEATNHSYADMDGKTTLVTQAANTLFRKGVFVVSSAGNSAQTDWHFISAPADGDSVLAVGAVDKNKNYAFFSSTGKSFDGDIKPNVSAQGHQTILAHTSNGYVAGSGTSFSGPIVAGLTACYWQAFPDLKNWELKNQLELNASQYSTPDSLLGFGLPNYMTMYMNARKNDEFVYGQSFLISLRNNPFTDHVGIELYSAIEQNVHFLLLDVNGKEIRNVDYVVTKNEYSIFGLDDLKSLSSGIYFLRVYGENGEWLTKKVLKL